MTELLDMSEPDTERRGWLAELRSSTQALQTMLDRMLYFAMLEGGSVQLVRDPFNLREIIEMAVIGHRPAGDSKGLAISAKLAGLPDIVLGDPHRLRDVLDHLLENAVRFTDAGDVSVQAARFNGPEGDSRVWVGIGIRDTGCGISLEHLQQVFDALNQVDGSITRKIGDNGLGLAICRHPVAPMGGTLTVDSALGAGSTFWLRVPLEVVALD